jgi:hypothetical protein
MWILAVGWLFVIIDLTSIVPIFVGDDADYRCDEDMPRGICGLIATLTDAASDYHILPSYGKSVSELRVVFFTSEFAYFVSLVVP